MLSALMRLLSETILSTQSGTLIEAGLTLVQIEESESPETTVYVPVPPEGAEVAVALGREVAFAPGVPVVPAGVLAG
jgi:hypothetical protein